MWLRHKWYGWKQINFNVYLYIYYHFELRRLDMNNVISNSYICLFISTTIGQISMAAKQVALLKEIEVSLTYVCICVGFDSRK